MIDIIIMIILIISYNILINKGTYQPEHPLQPQCIHSTILPSSNFPFGTRQIQFVPKLVSRVCIQRKQHKFSYPTFFHFAIRFLSAMFSFRQ